MDGGVWWAAVHRIRKSRERLSDSTFTFPFHALEKEMAPHSSVLAWRIPGTGEPGGLPSMGSLFLSEKNLSAHFVCLALWKRAIDLLKSVLLKFISAATWGLKGCQKAETEVELKTVVLYFRRKIIKHRRSRHSPDARGERQDCAMVTAVREDFLGFLEFCCASQPLLPAVLRTHFPYRFLWYKIIRKESSKILWNGSVSYFLGSSFSAEILKLGLELHELEFLF